MRPRPVTTAWIPVLLCASMLAAAPAAAAGKKIPRVYLDLEDCPDAPGCPGIVLYDVTDSNHWVPFYRRRRLLKVFTGEGVQSLSDIPGIHLHGNLKLSDLQGRTILPDGTEIPLSRKNIRTKKLKRGKSTTRVVNAGFSGVVPGSLLEWSYEIKADYVYDIWEFQDSIPVLQSIYVLKPGDSRYGWVQAGLEKFDIEVETPEERTWVFRASRIPPFSSEPLGPDPSSSRARMYIARGRFFKDWLKELARDIANEVGLFIETGDGAGGIVESIIKGSDSELEKARRLYRYTQDHIRTEEDFLAGPGHPEIEDPENALDVINHGYGNEWQRTLAFLALARAAGLKHALLLISSRYHGPFDDKIPDPDVLDSFSASVQVDGNWKTVDPATPFCPFGWVSPEKEGTGVNGIMIFPFVKPAGDAGVASEDILAAMTPYLEIEVPSSRGLKNMVVRAASLRLSEDGSGLLEVEDRFSGQSALAHRTRFAPIGPEERGRVLGTDLERKMPGATLLRHSFENLSPGESDPVLNYSASIPGAAVSIPDRLIVDSSVFHSRDENLFTTGNRRTPVLLPFAPGSREHIHIIPPDGYEADGLPDPLLIEDPPFHFSLSFSDGDGLEIEREYVIDVPVIPPDMFPRLQDFQERVQAVDRRGIVFIHRPTDVHD